MFWSEFQASLFLLLAAMMHGAATRFHCCPNQCYADTCVVKCYRNNKPHQQVLKNICPIVLLFKYGNDVGHLWTVSL